MLLLSTNSPMASFLPFSLPLVVVFLLLSPLTLADNGMIGINYGRVADDLPTPSQVVQLFKTQGISQVKLYDTDPEVLSAFNGSGISLIVALPNENLTAAATSQSFTDDWVQTRIQPYNQDPKISAISVGNEVNTLPNLISSLVPAMNNLYASLQKFSLSSISLSSPISLAALGSSYPSSSGSFDSNLTTQMIKPMLDFLRKTEAPLMVNVYPFFAYAANADQINIDYALFRDNPGVSDSGNGLKYNNLFEAQLDAVYAAMSKLGYDDVKVLVTETGWPSKGDEDEVGASGPNAAAYNGNLVRRVLTKGGTPLRPNDDLEVYLFALFNEDLKPGPTSERNYGLFYPNQEKVYDIPLTAAEVAAETAVSPATAENGGSKVLVPGATWCVANEGAGQETLLAALNYACGPGKADCGPIQPGATCYDPNSLLAHASYAFNSYYQMNARVSGSCDFGGVAHVVTQVPQFGSCEFPTGNGN